MNDRVVQELPNINDPDVIRRCVCVQDMRRCLNTFFQHVVCQLRHIPVTAGVRVALAIVDRVTEGSLSVELLCQKNRARDAAVLLLCLHELRLDLQYIALDRSRANCWLKHSKTDKKPWRVSSQLEEIYTNENELKAERWLYRQYSMVKHCNPVGENFVFGIAAKRDSLTLGSRSHDSVMLRTHLFGLGHHINCSGAAAARIWADEGIEVNDYMDKLNEQWNTLSRYEEEYILSVLRGRDDVTHV